MSPIFRPFRNSDPPALTRLWNARELGPGIASLLRVHEIDAHAWGCVHFDSRGLTVAEIEGQIVGFVHAGFGPDYPIPAPRPFEVSREIGAISQLVVRPDHAQTHLAAELIQHAEDYLRDRGARVIYGGSLFPLNPYYWGISGGSEGSGVGSGEHAFLRALDEMGYQPASSTILLEARLVDPETRDPRAAMIRRQTRVEFQEDPLPADWWEGVALGNFPMMQARLVSKATDAIIASAATWEMGWFSRMDGQSRVGLIKLHVDPSHRRKGHGRFLVSEIFRRLRDHQVQVVCAQTGTTNLPALGLYASLGFEPIDQSTLYRLPAETRDRRHPVAT